MGQCQRQAVNRLGDCDMVGPRAQPVRQSQHSTTRSIAAQHVRKIRGWLGNSGTGALPGSPTPRAAWPIGHCFAPGLGLRVEKEMVGPAKQIDVAENTALRAQKVGIAARAGSKLLDVVGGHRMQQARAVFAAGLDLPAR